MRSQRLWRREGRTKRKRKLLRNWWLKTNRSQILKRLAKRRWKFRRVYLDQKKLLTTPRLARKRSSGKFSNSLRCKRTLWVSLGTCHSTVIASSWFRSSESSRWHWVKRFPWVCYWLGGKRHKSKWIRRRQIKWTIKRQIPTLKKISKVNRLLATRINKIKTMLLKAVMLMRM